MKQELPENLVCPVTKAPLVHVGDWLYSTDSQTRLRYPVENGIPIMLIDEAKTVCLEDFERVMVDEKNKRKNEHKKR